MTHPLAPLRKGRWVAAWRQAGGIVPLAVAGIALPTLVVGLLRHLDNNKPRICGRPLVGHSPLPAFRHEQWCFNKLLPHYDGLWKKPLKCNHCRKYRQHCRGDQWSPVFYCFVGNHRAGCRNNRTGRRVSSSPKRSPCRLSPGAPAARRCRSRAHAACTCPRWSCRRGSTPRS